jgi:hypothetical protein
MGMFIRPKREHFIHFIARAGAIVKRYENIPARAGYFKSPTEGMQKYGRKVEIATLGNIGAITPMKVRVEEKRPSMFGNARASVGKPVIQRGFAFGKKGK